MPEARRGEKFKFASLSALPKWGLEGSCKWTTHAKNKWFKIKPSRLEKRGLSRKYNKQNKKIQRHYFLSMISQINAHCHFLSRIDIHPKCVTQVCKRGNDSTKPIIQLYGFLNGFSESIWNIIVSKLFPNQKIAS